MVRCTFCSVPRLSIGTSLTVGAMKVPAPTKTSGRSTCISRGASLRPWRLSNLRPSEVSGWGKRMAAKSENLAIGVKNHCLNRSACETLKLEIGWTTTRADSIQASIQRLIDGSNHLNPFQADLSKEDVKPQKDKSWSRFLGKPTWAEADEWCSKLGMCLLPNTFSVHIDDSHVLGSKLGWPWILPPTGAQHESGKWAMARVFALQRFVHPHKVGLDTISLAAWIFGSSQSMIFSHRQMGGWMNGWIDR